MLEKIGVNSVKELYHQLPEDILIKGKLALPQGLSELEVSKELVSLSKKNLSLEQINSFLGAGCYDHYIPSAVDAIIRNSEFTTAYTPYQPEVSQGILQAIFEYQSYICRLTGMDVSNASLFDGASALAEAVLMALRVRQRRKVLVTRSLNPQYRQTLKTYLDGLPFQIEEIGFNNSGQLDQDNLDALVNDDLCCLVVPLPNFFGVVEDFSQWIEKFKKRNVLVIAVVNPLLLAVLTPPSTYSVDIVCGDGQPLGNSPSFGGPSFGFIATKSEYLRQIPGRIVGQTTDKDGKLSYCLTLQTREQHIRREKATSNICSNQSLCAISATVYLALMGKRGLEDVVNISYANTLYLYRQLSKIAQIRFPFSGNFLNEFVWQVEDAQKVLARLSKENICAGYYLGKDYPELKNMVLSCCTEKKTKEEINQFVDALKKLYE